MLILEENLLIKVLKNTKLKKILNENLVYLILPSKIEKYNSSIIT